jgi:hypothetical protein
LRPNMRPKEIADRLGLPNADWHVARNRFFLLVRGAGVASVEFTEREEPVYAVRFTFRDCGEVRHGPILSLQAAPTFPEPLTTMSRA